jgi:hypothetical protein
MIINGVTLPDIPADILAEYPYAVIVHTSYGGDQYILVACDSTFYYVSKELSGSPYGDGSVVGKSGVGVVYGWQNSSTEWTQTDEEVFIPVGELILSGTLYGVYTLVWANHDVCIATSFTSPTEVTIGTEVYFPNSESVIKPTRYSIAGAILEGIAKHIRRLTITDDKIKPENMGAMLETVQLANDLPHAEEVKF